MKKFAKFIPVALGLLTLASCSNDNLFSESQEAVQLKDGDMLVTMAEPQEDGDAFTRGYTSRDMVSRRWFSGIDKLRVYGLSFSGPFDTYMFVQGLNASTGQFQRVNSSTSLADPAWALFPYDQIVNGKWEQLPGLYNSKVTVNMSIPQVVEYDAAYDAANYDKDKQPYFIDNLPRWGKVTATNNGANLETTLNWMTGVLRLQLAGAPKYSNGIRVQMFENGDRKKPIRLNSATNKYWNVQIAHNNEPVKGACIEFTGQPEEYATTGREDIDGALYVHMENVDKLTPEDAKKAVVFLPLPVTPGKQVEIVVSVWDFAAANKTTWDGVVNTAATYGGTDFVKCWKEYASYKNKNIKLGYLYGNKSEYNLALDGTNTDAISDALELIETSEDVITVVANNPIDVCKANQQTTIEIPNKVGKKQIVLDLRNGLAGCSTEETLNIVYKDATDKFEGNVTLITPATDKGNPVKLNVALDKSSFSIVQSGSLIKTAGGITIDAREFVVGNEDPLTPTLTFAANNVTFSQNVKKFWVASQASINGFDIDQSDVNPENWKHGAVEEIVINGKAGISGGAIDAKNKVKKGYEVAVKVEGENANTVDIFTYGPVEINAGTETTPSSIDDILAKSVTATGWATLGTIGTPAEPIAETITLTGNIVTSNVIPNTSDALVAKGNISISDEANVPTGKITSEEGNITIDNAYTPANPLVLTTPVSYVPYMGSITAEKGIVSVNQVGVVRTFFNGAITANEFAVTGMAVTGTVTAHGKATINVDAQDGACIAVNGSLTLDNPTANELYLTQGYVKELVNPAAVETSLTFSDNAAYAALGAVANPNKLIPTNTSIWNGDWRLAEYKAVWGAEFGAATFNHDGGRIWTATQLGYQNYDTTSGTIEIRANIDLKNEDWPGIKETTATTIKGNGWTISNLNLIGDKTAKAAGFYNTCAADLTISDLTFDGVQTNIKGVSGGVYEGGIGAVAGKLLGSSSPVNAILTRVKVKLAGKNFGAAVPVKNDQTNYVGGLIGQTDGATLTGCQVDATGVALTGYKCLGGFIGRSYHPVTIQMAEEDYVKGIDPVYPTVTGLEFYVTYDATKAITGEKNDQYQGSTGWFIGSINYQKNLTISDVPAADLKRKIAQASGSLANEKVACWIESVKDYYWFVRTKLNGQEKADQTLIGNSGFEYDPTAAGDMKINNVRFEIHKSGASLKDSDSKKLYSIIKDAYNH